MDEAGLWFCATRAPAGKLFRFVTKQEFDVVGVVIPGSALAPGKVAGVNLMTREVAIQPLRELLAQGEICAMGFRRLVKTADADLNRLREGNLRLLFQRLSALDGAPPQAAEEPPASAAPSAEVPMLLLGEATELTKKLRQFVDELEIPLVPGKICLRALEELAEELRGLEADPTPDVAVAATLFRNWFAGGEVAALLTSLTTGQSPNFHPLLFERIPPPAALPTSFSRPAAKSVLPLVCEVISRAGSDGAFARRLAAGRAKAAGGSAGGSSRRQLAAEVARWTSGTARALLLPELPVIDLSPMLLLADLQMPRPATRSCVVTTKPTAKPCLEGDVVVDRAGLALDLLTVPQLEQLELELSRSAAPEDLRLRSLVAQRLAT